MTEFAVAAASLSLLLLGTITIAGYQEVDRRTLMSVRQWTYQSGWLAGRAADEQTAEALHRDYFTDPGVREVTGRRLLVKDEDLAVTTANSAPEGIASQALRAMLLPLQAAGGFLGGSFDLASDALHTGFMQVRVSPLPSLPAPFSTLELQWQVPYALQSDAWHSGSTQQVSRRAAALVPAVRLAALGDAWRPLRAPLSLLEPSIDRLCPGLIEPDRIPEDRLGPGVTALPGRCP